MFENYRKHPWNYFNKLFPQLAWMDGKDLHRFYNFDERGIAAPQPFVNHTDGFESWVWVESGQGDGDHGLFRQPRPQ